MNKPLNFAKEIKQIRTRAKLSQREMASLFGVSQGTISKLEDGTLYPTLGLLREIRLKFNFNVNKFLDKSE